MHKCKFRMRTIVVFALTQILLLSVIRFGLLHYGSHMHHKWALFHRSLSHNWHNFKADIGFLDEFTSKPCSHIENSHFTPSYKQITTASSIQPKIMENSIAIGMAITTVGTKWYTTDQILTTFPFFTTFMPSFCNTVSSNFTYSFFLSYDMNDPFYTKELCITQFEELFYGYTAEHCTNRSNYRVQFVLCKHTKQPARAQNTAMMHAYLENMQYYYRSNDDTSMITPDWTRKFIDVLKAFDPPNVGIVGPTHKGGNTVIMTYEFVHYTHFHIHGFYYPPQFTDWFADDWMTMVYAPNNSRKLSTVLVEHTLEKGTRYKGHLSFRQIIGQLIEQGKHTIKRYVTLTQKNRLISPNPKLVISMSLWDRERQHIYGVIRNAQLRPIYFPEWTLRIYIANQSANIYPFRFRIPNEILQKLMLLGVELVYVDRNISSFVIPELWKYLIVNDASVEYFMVRNVDRRFSERDSLLTQHWRRRAIQNIKHQSDRLKFENNSANEIGRNRKLEFHRMKFENNSAYEIGQNIKLEFHRMRNSTSSKEIDRHFTYYFCVRDLEKHKYKSIVPGLFGAQLSTFTKQLGTSSINKLILYNNTRSEEYFLDTVIWPKIKRSCHCYNNFVDDRFENSLQIPTYIEKTATNLGNTFDEYGQLL